MKEQKKPLVIRMSPQMRDWIEMCSEKNGRSANGEVIFRLKSMMEEEVSNAKNKRT